MPEGAESVDLQARTGLSARRFDWPWLFGYDFFVSFKLGPYPAGEQSYASDLTRGLRERDFTVFFSEDEAPAGGYLDETLRKAIKRSRVLVVIASGNSLSSRWVKLEVEEFRKVNPRRPIVIVDIDNALGRNANAADLDQWLDHSRRLRIDDSRSAAEQGIVGAGLVGKVSATMHSIRANVRLRTTVLIVVAVLAGLTYYSYTKRMLAEENGLTALSRQKAAEARAIFAGQHDQALQLAVEAITTKPTPEARGNLLAALQNRPNLRAYLHFGERVQSIAMAPDGASVVVGGEDGTIALFDLRAMRQPEKLPTIHKRMVWSLAFSGQGTMASADQDGQVVLWDMESRKPKWNTPLRVADGPLASVALTSDGKVMAAGGADGLKV